MRSISTISRRGLLTAAMPLLAGLRPAGADVIFTPEQFIILPLRIHLLRSQVADLNCSLTPADARKLLAGINEIWRQAGIQFYAESLLEEKAEAAGLYASLEASRTEAHLRLIRPRETRTPATFHLYLVQEIRPNGVCLEFSHELVFVKATAELRRVEGGCREFLPRVSAHELGHALGLEHRQDTFNLLASGTTGTLLNETEIDLSRLNAGKFAGRLTPQQAMQMAVNRGGNGSALFEVLAALPGGGVAAEARRRLESLRATRPRPTS